MVINICSWLFRVRPDAHGLWVWVMCIWNMLCGFNYGHGCSGYAQTHVGYVVMDMGYVYGTVHVMRL